MTMADSLRSKIASLMRSPELRGVATLGVGTAVSQLLPVVMSFILSRLYTPEAFGDYGVFINYASVIAIVICARYEYAIMRPRREVDALNLVALCLLLACGVTVLLYALLGAADIAGADVGCRRGCPVEIPLAGLCARRGSDADIRQLCQPPCGLWRDGLGLGGAQCDPSRLEARHGACKGAGWPCPRLYAGCCGGVCGFGRRHRCGALGGEVALGGRYAADGGGLCGFPEVSVGGQPAQCAIDGHAGHID